MQCDEQNYVVSLIDGKPYNVACGAFVKHLKKNGYTPQQYHEQFITGVEELCDCGRPKTFNHHKKIYANSCGDPVCVGKIVSKTKKNWSEEQRKKDSESKKKAATMKTTEQKKMSHDKGVKTQIQKYGDICTRIESVKEKCRLTKWLRYGNEYYSGWEKSAEKNRNKTAQEQMIINQKRAKTNLESHGIECVLLRKDKSVINSLKTAKQYIFKSGKEVWLRGYEVNALKILLNIGYEEGDICVDDVSSDVDNGMPVIRYVCEKGRNRTFYPDFYIRSENIIIEVKSRWWYDGHGDDRYMHRYIKNITKMKAAISAGYKFQFWIYEEGGEITVIDNV